MFGWALFKLHKGKAMYYGAVVLTTRNGGSSTLIKNGVNGFIIRKDVDKWSDCISRIDSDKRKRISNYASQTISENYTWNSLANTFIAQYMNRLKSK